MGIAEQVNQARQQLDSLLRKAAVAEVGGFRPPDTYLTSWFGGPGVGLPGETLPIYNGKDMFPLLQVRIDELPFVTEAFVNTALFVLFMNREDLPFDQPHVDGWMIREYASLNGLEPLALSSEADIVKSFPIRWNLIEGDAPGWEDLSEIVDWPQRDDDTNTFHEAYKTYGGTKIGGFPSEIQHGAGVKDFVFQIDSEPKANWQWGDGGIGYFHKTEDAGHLAWQCL